ncbi:uncharacterized protein [Rutidosis leptorrhynchoides]|uniref:uncharacterized protein n=1 Tax=Rutidosis leptorrhynchoides TaxID=125765 RepID=UPI003A993F61
MKNLPKDPLYFVLARHQKRDVTGPMIGVSVVTARVLVVVLGSFVLGLSIYALVVDGLPFRAKLLSSCMIMCLTDISIHVVIFSVWVAYKESSWISAVFWILLIACFSR